MAQRKYLIFLAFILFPKLTKASAWLLPKGHYRINYAHQRFNHQGNKLAALAEDYYLNLMLLREYKYDRLTPERMFEIKEISEEYYNYVMNEIFKNHEWMRFYQYSKDNNINFDYGATNEKNFGFNLTLNRTQFLGKVKNYKSLDIFYKTKLYEERKKILSLQTKFIIEDHYIRPQEYFIEWGLLYGRSKKFKKIETFLDSNIRIAGCIPYNCKDRGWFSAASTEGIKLPYGFIISNYNQYQIWFHDNNKDKISFHGIEGFRIPHKTTQIFYEQISIAKNINFSKVNNNEFYLQFSYFIKTNLARHKLKIKGIKLSAWLEI